MLIITILKLAIASFYFQVGNTCVIALRENKNGNFFIVANGYGIFDSGREKLEKIFAEMQYQPMPAERPEFENRAVLYSFMLLLKEFLCLKYEFVCKISTDFVEKEKK